MKGKESSVQYCAVRYYAVLCHNVPFTTALPNMSLDLVVEEDSGPNCFATTQGEFERDPYLN